MKMDESISEGYDGHIDITNFSAESNYRKETPQFTKDELIELSEIMIRRWQEFRFDVISNEVPSK